MIKHIFADSIYIRQQTLAAGQIVSKHVHEYEHVSYLVQGQCVVEVEGKMTHVVAPKAIVIAAHKQHFVRAITDITWLCIHNTDVADPDFKEV